MDTAIRTLRLEPSKRGRPNAPGHPSSVGNSQRDLDAPIPKELVVKNFFNLFFFLYSVIASAKLLQSCPTLCDPIDSSPPGSPVSEILQAEHWSGLPFPSPMHESEK